MVSIQFVMNLNFLLNGGMKAKLFGLPFIGNENILPLALFGKTELFQGPRLII